MTATISAPAGPEPVLRVPAVAAHLDVDPNTVYDLIAKGELRAIRVGRLIRIPESALAEFVARGSR